MGMSYTWISTLITIYIKDTSNYLVDTTLGDKFCQILATGRGFFSWISCFLLHKNWPPQYNWNTVKDGINHRIHHSIMWYIALHMTLSKINVREYRSGNKIMDNPEKLEHRVHKTKKNKVKNNSICVGRHYPQANRNNVNNTWGNMACIVLACRVDIT